jgi:hypothetical protein
MACATSQTIDIRSSLIPPYENPPVKNAYVAFPSSACIRIYRYATLTVEAPSIGLTAPVAETRKLRSWHAARSGPDAGDGPMPLTRSGLAAATLSSLPALCSLLSHPLALGRPRRLEAPSGLALAPNDP